MAVVKSQDLSRVMVQVQTGVDTNGKAILKNRTFSNVKAAAPDQDVFDVANALGNLQRFPVEAVLREDNSELALV